MGMDTIMGMGIGRDVRVGMGVGIGMGMGVGVPGGRGYGWDVNSVPMGPPREDNVQPMKRHAGVGVAARSRRGRPSRLPNVPTRAASS